MLQSDAQVTDLTDQFVVGSEDKQSLKATHPLYKQHLTEWQFLLACYEGVQAMLAQGLLYQNERESKKNWDRRCKEAYTFNYSRSVIDLFNFYQFKAPIRRQLGSLGDQQDWVDFETDCDRDGDNLDNFMMEQSKLADIHGHIGIFVDRPKANSPTGEFVTAADAAGQYPYLCAYLPQNILDWEFERDYGTGNRLLTYLKLLDDEGYYRLWYLDHWEVWELPVDEKGVEAGDPNLVDSGPNPLGEIPFVWLYCEKSSQREIGRSDIRDIARIDASIMRNLSQAEEIISYSAFPMMRKPFREPGQSESGDDVGVTAVLGFDPAHPESKPDWLSSECGPPLDAITAFIMKKIEEIYRASNAGGLAATEIEGQAKSGVALRTEFQLLNGKLIRKSENVVKAERQLIYFFCLWKQQPELMDDVMVERPRTFEIEDLATDLNNVLTAKTICVSATFDAELQKQTVRMMLPTVDDETISTIDDEIDTAIEEAQQPGYADGLDQYMNGMGLTEEDLAALDQQQQVDAQGNPIPAAGAAGNA
jgi:hypothetical protein